MSEPEPAIADSGVSPESVLPDPALPPAPPEAVEPPPPPGPGSWRWDAVAGAYVRLTKET
jgi:hypothetical protein